MGAGLWERKAGEGDRRGWGRRGSGSGERAKEGHNNGGRRKRRKEWVVGARTFSRD